MVADNKSYGCPKSNLKENLITKIMVTGSTGQLGYDVCKELERRGLPYIGIGHNDIDITDKVKTKNFIKYHAPDAIIHCAAYTAVDNAESEPKKCFEVNEGGTSNIVEACKELDCKLIYISTDYVFSGSGTKPNEVSEKPAPQNVYGRSKLAGELIVQNSLEKYFIVRTSWVFGRNGNNFVKTMLRIASGKDEISVVSDQTGSPTYTVDLAQLLCDMVVSHKYGVYHATNEGFCSWAEFAEEIFKTVGYEIKVNNITSEEYPTKAPRPKNSRLSKSKLETEGFLLLPIWQDAIKRYVKEIGILDR